MIKESVMNFVGFRLKNLDYQLKSVKELIEKEDFKEESYEENKISTNIKHGIANSMDHGNRRQLNILFNVKYFKNNNRIEIEVEINALFDFNEELTAEVENNFLIINGTTILYPYIRNIIYSVSSIDTEGNNIILPVVNLSALLNNNDTEHSD